MATSLELAAVPHLTSRSLRRPEIWAVASGKGGVGKSVISSSLGIGFSQTGPNVVAADLDFGGANLHSLFGCEASRFTLGDVLQHGGPSLDEALTATTVPGLSFVSGARGALGSATPNSYQKERLLRQLHNIDAGHVIVDLGAGAHIATLDAFLAADRRIVVMTPERTSIENAYHFLKEAFFRSLRHVVSEPDVHAALSSVLEVACSRGYSPRELVQAACEASPDVGTRLWDAARSFDAYLVVNRVRMDGSRDPAPEMAAACRAHLGATLHATSSLPIDDAVPAAVERGVPVMQLYPGSNFSRGIDTLVRQLLDEVPPIVACEDAAPRGSEPVSRPAPERTPRQEEALVAPSLSLPAFSGSAPGAYLRSCRELHGLSVEQVSLSTRIRQIAEIEDERFDTLPADPYVRAFVQQIAETLGVLDVDAVVRSYLEARHGGAPQNDRRGLRWLRWLQRDAKPSAPVSTLTLAAPATHPLPAIAAPALEPEAALEPVRSGPEADAPATCTPLELAKPVAVERPRIEALPEEKKPLVEVPEAKPWVTAPDEEVVVELHSAAPVEEPGDAPPELRVVSSAEAHAVDAAADAFSTDTGDLPRGRFYRRRARRGGRR